jgi:AraC-like DNA-binding protein
MDQVISIARKAQVRATIARLSVRDWQNTSHNQTISDEPVMFPPPIFSSRLRHTLSSFVGRVGFASQSHFTTTFRRLTWTTPKAFREML